MPEKNKTKLRKKFKVTNNGALFFLFPISSFIVPKSRNTDEHNKIDRIKISNIFLLSKNLKQGKKESKYTAK